MLQLHCFEYPKQGAYRKQPPGSVGAAEKSKQDRLFVGIVGAPLDGGPEGQLCGHVELPDSHDEPKVVVRSISNVRVSSDADPVVDVDTLDVVHDPFQIFPCVRRKVLSI